VFIGFETKDLLGKGIPPYTPKALYQQLRA
jgi:hypothetical protein